MSDKGAEQSLGVLNERLQLGFAVLRFHPRNIHRVVFSGVEGPDHTLKLPDNVERQLQRLDEFIKADPALHSRYAEPQAVVARRVLTRADREPLVVAGPEGQVRLGSFDIQMALAGLIGTRGGMAVLPPTLAAIDSRDAGSELVQDMAAGSAGLRTLLTSAIPFAVDCSWEPLHAESSKFVSLPETHLCQTSTSRSRRLAGHGG